jgi:hypothetical protein
MDVGDANKSKASSYIGFSFLVGMGIGTWTPTALSWPDAERRRWNMDMDAMNELVRAFHELPQNRTVEKRWHCGLSIWRDDRAFSAIDDITYTSQKY